MKENLKTRLRNGDVVLGTWCTLPFSSLVNVIGLSGIDFVVLDGEHGNYDFQVMEDCVRAAEVSGVSPLIRVPTNAPHWILKALDTGALGVQVPHVATKADAQKIIQAAKYAPQGERGYTPFTRAGKYGMEAEGHAKRSNEKTIVVANIEGMEGIKNLNTILEVDGIDVIFIGPYDLSQSLGIPGEVEDPRVIERIEECATLIRKKSVACGSYAGSEKMLEKLIACGVQYITYSVDSEMVRKTYSQLWQMFHRHKQGALRNG